MSKIYSILNPKGGSGKSTLCTNLARAFQLDGLKVLIVDTDRQQTASDWSAAQGEDSDLPAVTSLTKAVGLERHVKQLAAGFDVLLVDGAAQLQDVSAGAIKASDAILLPCGPSNADVWAVEEIVDLIKARQEVTGGAPRAAFVVTRQIVGTNLSREIGGALEAYGLPVLSSRISLRVAYAEALSAGSTVLDYEPRSAAADEVRALFTEFKGLVNGR